MQLVVIYHVNFEVSLLQHSFEGLEITNRVSLESNRYWFVW